MGNQVALPAQPNLSLINGLECLEMLISLQRPVGTRDLARMLQMEHTRVNRLLGTLACLGLAERTPNRKYTSGPGIHVLAAMSLRGSRLLASALRRLPPLMVRTKDCRTALGVLWRSYVCYIFYGASDRPLDESIGNTAPYDAERSSIGRILLAYQPARTVQAVYRARTQNCLSNSQLKKLLQDLGRVRKRKYALVRNGEHLSIGVAVGSPPVAGLAVTGKINARRVPGIVKRLHEISALITTDLAAARNTHLRSITPAKPSFVNNANIRTIYKKRNKT
ncbi:MAG: IclR family transcriptional regulator C-terminal domain-containing protein [Kiritimatiellia bacterium]|nr:IclR family transcriptional regulator C-terminal domain-containing protein [Kiritimatiellia bacterium]